MVAYCCVKGCRNNSSNKKKDPNDITSFHAFPSNSEMKQKWLRAIGRPDWAPPSYARLCSAHFSYEQINHDGRRIRIKDDAVPVKYLPVNSNFEASHVEVCRFCLAADLKMYNLQAGVYRVYLESIVGYNENYNIEGLPQFVCYECAAHLKKCYILLEKSMIAQATLLDIFAHNGKITKNLINLQNRKELNLSSSLAIYEMNTNFEYKCSDSSELNICVNETEDHSKNLENVVIHIIEETNSKSQSEDANEMHFESMEINVNDTKHDDDDDEKDNAITDMNYELDDYTEKLSSDDELKSTILDIVIEKETKKNKTRNKHVKSIHNVRLTPDEVKMQKYFTIQWLTLEQQIEEWNKNKGTKQCSDDSFKCEICSKVFAHSNTYRLHTLSHNPTRGDSVCVVCKLRYKNEVLARSHANRAHAKKFHCKTCPKSFNNVAVAKKHHKWHSGYMYECAECAFSSAHASALSAHARAQHAGALACARCGRAFPSARGLALHAATVHPDSPEPEDNQMYKCQQCDLSFKSEGARRVHLLTSKQHKRNNSLCDSTPQDPSLKNTCNKCGLEFSMLKELVEHGRAEHRRAKQKKTSWSRPDDCYPTPCEHCGTTVNSRKEHWGHVRRQHPAERGSYRPVVTAVCDTCGKGFQNVTKLQLHALRHGAARVACGLCAREFFDKYALARHAAVHAAARPHRCRACPRAFKQRANLDRHSRVHTGVTPYECSMCGKKFKYSTSMNLHVRTVHYKLPHPPRKKKKSKQAEDDDNFGK